MKNLFIASIIVLSFTSTLFAKLMIIPLDEAIKESEVIIIGTLKEISEISDSGTVYGKGVIVIEKFIAGNIENIEELSVKPNDKIRLNYVENFACVYGSHKRIENKKGIFLLTFDGNGEIQYVDFRSMESLTEIKKLLKKGIKTKEIDNPIKLLKFDQQIPISSQNKQSSENSFCELSIEKSNKNEYSPFQALLVILISFPTYYLLYRSRFKIR